MATVSSRLNDGMNFRSQVRNHVIRSAALLRADKLALFVQSLRQNPESVVIAMHETPHALKDKFRDQLEWAAQHFTITTLEGFAGLWDEPRRRSGSKPLLLFTFDDGRESNYSIAAPLLESLGGRGVFFVVPAFAECTDQQSALDFYRARINPQSRPGEEALEDWRPMNPAQVADLSARGHAIGNHTLTHQRLMGLSPETLDQEIAESARKLSSWTKKPVEAFAWTFGWDQIDANAWRCIQHHHRFCFSPCAGTIHPGRDQPSLLWRREIEARYSAPEFGFSYSGLVDLWWGNRRKQLRAMLLPSRP
jgi:peptidoglycan/xylan/chitin deacetylase (PgdA/CDA1 family)